MLNSHTFSNCEELWFKTRMFKHRMLARRDKVLHQSFKESGRLILPRKVDLVDGNAVQLQRRDGFWLQRGVLLQSDMPQCAHPCFGGCGERKYRKGVDVGAPKIANCNVSTQISGSDHHRGFFFFIPITCHSRMRMTLMWPNLSYLESSPEIKCVTKTRHRWKKPSLKCINVMINFFCERTVAGELVCICEWKPET